MTARLTDARGGQRYAGQDGDLRREEAGDGGREGPVRRVYEAPERDDGTRVLVDRIWPRGLTKAKAALDEWCKDVAPSSELRKWYNHDPGRFEDFARRSRRSCGIPDGRGHWRTCVSLRRAGS